MHIFKINTLIMRNTWCLLPYKIWKICGKKFQRGRERTGVGLTCILTNYISQYIFGFLFNISISVNQNLMIKSDKATLHCTNLVGKYSLKKLKIYIFTIFYEFYGVFLRYQYCSNFDFTSNTILKNQIWPIFWLTV